MDKRATPPLKWAGGKRWFVARYLHLIPPTFDTYIEPFLGSGALFFALRPSRAVLSDLNQELIDVYRGIRERPLLVRRYLQEHQRLHCAAYYYFVRDMTARSLARRAARTIYLNRTCWNGLYRVNRRGRFNVPIGTKSNVLLETDDFQKTSTILKACELHHIDFEITLDRAKMNDFVFIDPPYTLSHNTNGFIKYNETIFSWSDQLRLAAAVTRAVDRGVKVLATNANHESIHELYSSFDRLAVSRSGVIAADRLARKPYEEVIIRCY